MDIETLTKEIKKLQNEAAEKITQNEKDFWTDDKPGDWIVGYNVGVLAGLNHVMELIRGSADV